MHPSLSREVALIVLAKVEAAKLKGSNAAIGKDPALTPYIRAMNTHFDLWQGALEKPGSSKWPHTTFSGDELEYLSNDEYVRPFMVAISLHGAITLSNETNDVDLLNKGVDTLLMAYEKCLVPGEGLRYTDRDLPAESVARQKSGDVADDEVVTSLNLLVANVALEASKVVADAPRRDALLKLHANLTDITNGSDLDSLKEAMQANWGS